MKRVILTIVTLWLTIKGSVSINTIEFTPTSVNGVLTACAGQQISLTCSHEGVSFGGTQWIASPPVNCVTFVSHIGVTPPPPPPCGPFMFQEITPLLPVTPTVLNSTAVATAVVGMNGTNIECRGGNTQDNFFSVGNVSLSVVDTTATNLMAIQISLVEVRLEWLISPDAESCNVSFYVDIEGSNDFRMNSSSGSSLQLTVELRPGSYAFNVISMSGSERLVSQEQSFQVINNVPSRPTNVSVELVTSDCMLNHVSVSWSAPVTDDNLTPNVSGYHFQYGRLVPGRDETVNVVAYDTENTTITIPGSNFSSIAEYKFSITAINRAGRSEVTSEIASVSPSIRRSVTFGINDTAVTINLIVDQNCIQLKVLFEVQYVRCPVMGECICDNQLSYAFSVTTRANSTALTNLFAGNRYCYRSRVKEPVVVDWIYPPNGSYFLTPNDYRPPKLGGASFVSGETYQCDSSLSGFGGSREQSSAIFRVEEGQWILTEECRVLSWFIAVIVILIMLVVAFTLIGVGIGGYMYYKKTRNVSEESKELRDEETIEMKSETYADPNSIEHEKAPDGEQYAMVDKSAKQKKVDVSTPTLYQDPVAIQHEQAPTGDFYAMPQQKGKKKGMIQVSSADPESTDVAAMYSTVDTSKKKQQLTYAQLDVGSSSGGKPVPQSTSYATVVT